jgi:hypothetical protein
MKTTVSLAVIPTLLALSVSTMAAQSSSQAPAASSPTSPVARIYLTYFDSNNAGSAPAPYEIVGYSADSAGRLTPIAGGPWPGIAEATTGGWLFAENDTLQYAVSYRVDSSGALHEAAKYDLANRAPDDCEKLENFDFLTLDHTGATLYALGQSTSDGFEGCASNALLQSYKINKETGELTYLGSINDDSLLDLSGLTFTGDNQIALGATGGDLNTCDCRIDAFLRQSDGLLVRGAATATQPIGAPAGQKYYEVETRADPDDHLAVWFVPTVEAGNEVLAAYTVHPDGAVTTSNTFDQMPATGYTSPPALGSGLIAMSISPSGKLLATLESGAGLRVYHFNGANPITPYVALLPSDESLASVAWDNANHLYVLGAQELYVFTVTPTSHSQVSGSPFTMPNGSDDILVRSMTP